MKQLITTKPIPSPWFHLVSLILTFCIMGFAVSFQSLLLVVLFFLAVIILVSMVSAHIELYLFGSELILSAQGIETTGRIGVKKTDWKDIVQVGATEYDLTKVLVLVKKGGRLWKKKMPNYFYIVCNPGKLIWLPDDQFTRAYVAQYYGPLDFDWTHEEE